MSRGRTEAENVECMTCGGAIPDICPECGALIVAVNHPSEVRGHPYQVEGDPPQHFRTRYRQKRLPARSVTCRNGHTVPLPADQQEGEHRG